MIKKLIIDINNRFNKVFSSFDLFNKKFASSSHLIDTFHSCFFFHSSSKQNNGSIKSYIHHFDNIAIKSSSDLSYALVVSDTSIKNNIVTLLYISIYIINLLLKLSIT